MVHFQKISTVPIPSSHYYEKPEAGKNLLAFNSAAYHVQAHMESGQVAFGSKYRGISPTTMICGTSGMKGRATISFPGAYAVHSVSNVTNFVSFDELLGTAPVSVGLLELKSTF